MPAEKTKIIFCCFFIVGILFFLFSNFQFVLADAGDVGAGVGIDINVVPANQTNQTSNQTSAQTNMTNDLNRYSSNTDKDSSSDNSYDNSEDSSDSRINNRISESNENIAENSEQDKIITLIKSEKKRLPEFVLSTNSFLLLVLLLMLMVFARKKRKDEN